MKHKVTMPKDEEKQYPIFPEGEHKFQITDYKEFPEQNTISATCEAIYGPGTGKQLFYRVALDGEFLWLTKLFLKCIGEPHNGDIDVDPDAWLGRQFWGEVKHSKGKDDKTYANIKKLIYKEPLSGSVLSPTSSNSVGAVASKPVTDPGDIKWED